MKVPLIALFAMLTFATTPLAVAQVNSINVHAGWVDIDAIASGEKALPLSEPTVRLQPAFDNDITSYAVRVPYGADGVTVVVERSAFPREGQLGVVDFNGVSGPFPGAVYRKQPPQGSPGWFVDSTIGTVFSFHLQPGDNQLRLGYRQETFLTADVYVLTMTRPESASGDTTLATLAIGTGQLTPTFDRDTRTYRTRIVGYGLTVTPTPTTGSVTVTGAAANGTTLQVDGNSVSGLTPGDNPIVIVVTAEDGSTESYGLTVEVSDDIREVAEGDTIVHPDDCDSECYGILNGVQGRFACDGVDWGSEFSNMQVSVSGLCLLTTSGGVVTNVAGWYFAAFPAQGRSSNMPLLRWLIVIVCVSLTIVVFRRMSRQRVPPRVG
ncbi:MAG: cadherin-like beta sandwich domain-containing protein [Acidobacteriia bacterium]|nr:cadherin-like beta sandwich domain-containing protein [Terriglobia bacterium]